MTNKKQNKEIEKIKEKIIPILKKNGVKRAGIFGSYARGEQNKDSDVDILVEFKEVISFFDFAGVKLEVEETIGRKVDLVDYKIIKPRIKEYVLKEEIKII